MKMGFLAAAAVALLVGACDGGLPQVGGQSVEIKPDDKIHGQPNAPVTIIEYASMTCPHCAAWAKDVLPQVNKEYIETGKAKLVFREFPLDGAAQLASTVARCFEGDQYFSFIDLLFANQMNWTKDQDGDQQLTRGDVIEGLAQIARQAGMPRERVVMCAEDMTNLAAVEANWREAQTRYNVGSTPSFIINGTTYAGGMSFEQMKQIIDPLAGS
jgi:protein-disulfide isomerase